MFRVKWPVDFSLTATYLCGRGINYPSHFQKLQCKKATKLLEILFTNEILQ